MTDFIADEFRAGLMGPGHVKLLNEGGGGGGSVWRNRIVNPSFQIDQENAGAAVTANNAYPADQWKLLHSSDGAVSAQVVAVRTPDGALNRLRVSVTTADAALSGAQHLTVMQPLEGSEMADFLFGTANARPGVLRIGVNAPAGTYCASIRNAANTRSFVGALVIGAGEANADVIKEVAFTGDMSGVWPTGDVLGWQLSVCLAAGSTLQGVAGWQGGNILATVAQTNGLGSTSNVFELFDIGLKLDPAGAGVYGGYEVPNKPAELGSCQYFFVMIRGATAGGRPATGVVAGPTGTSVQMPAPRQRVVEPVLTFNDLNEQSSGANHTVTALVGRYNGSMLEIEAASSGLTTGTVTQLRWISPSGWIKVNARM